MKKPPTGEPYAGKPPVRFGGRGRRKPIPTPIITPILSAQFPSVILDSGLARKSAPRNDGYPGNVPFAANTSPAR